MDTRITHQYYFENLVYMKWTQFIIFYLFGGIVPTEYLTRVVLWLDLLGIFTKRGMQNNQLNTPPRVVIPYWWWRVAVWKTYHLRPVCCGFLERWACISFWNRVGRIILLSGLYKENQTGRWKHLYLFFKVKQENKMLKLNT